MSMARHAFDRASVRTFDLDGRLHIAVSPITRANVCPYLGREIPNGEALGLQPGRVYNLFRDPEELRKSVVTWNGLPLLKGHAPTSADQPKKHLVVGAMGTDANWAAPYVTNSMVVWDATAIAGIETEEQREISAGYRYTADMTPGTFQGERYDGVMRNIAGNHVALVDRGRAGPDVVVGDRWPELPAHSAEQRFLERFPEAARIKIIGRR
jgi:hypothetical protein